MPVYAALIYAEEGEATPEEWAAIMADHNEFSERAGAAGVVAGGEALQDSNTATTVHVQGGKGGEVIHTDGPFLGGRGGQKLERRTPAEDPAETKEVLGGFYLLKCQDLDEALSWAAQIPEAWNGGRIEVRPCIGFTQE
ncbi:MAG: transcription initiation protein [Acidimicrobiia bacterium]|nr:transcription initiation protein [Acidimicrobiia bacterium]MDQ3500485.1 YciI family protein [Actinomycetota bacterium]